MNKIKLPGNYHLIYRYSIASDESYYPLSIYDNEYYKDDFKENYHIGSIINDNGISYKITDIRDQFDELFVCLKIIN